MKSSFLIVLCAVIFLSCKKKDSADPIPAPVKKTIDTIRPKSYFPVYPGSWWTYNNTRGTITTTMLTVSPSYTFYKYPNGTDSAYVPFLNGAPIVGYKRVGYTTSHGGGNYFFYDFLSETPGSCLLTANYEYCDHHDGQPYPCPDDHISFISKSVNSNGDSILTASGGYQSTSDIYFKYYLTVRVYTKNIGLTFYCYIDEISHDTTQSWKLKDYHIGAH